MVINSRTKKILIEIIEYLTVGAFEAIKEIIKKRIAIII